MLNEIVVIEDSPLFRDILEEVISRFLQGHNLSTRLTIVTDWRSESTIIAPTTEASLVFLDISLGRYNGLALLPKIKERGRGKVVVTSSSGQVKNITLAYGLGAMFYVTKSGRRLPYEGKIDSVLTTFFLAAERPELYDYFNY